MQSMTVHGGNGRLHRGAFTLLELMMAVLVLSVAIATLLGLSSQSQRQTMDAYFRFLALQMAQESLEVAKAVGHARLTARITADPTQPVPGYAADWADVAPQLAGPPGTPMLERPAQVTAFQRRVRCETVADGEVRGVRVTVEVRPKPEGWFKSWLVRSELSVSHIIMETLP